jgi:crossover junction endodeoxyribonuclease RuvC
MRVLGVDPGVARTGVAVVDGAPGALRLIHAECLETEPGPVDAERLAALFSALELLVAAHRPSAAAVEQLFFASNRRSAMRVGQARGVVLCALARAGVSVAEYTPLQVKEAVAGWGGAGKAQVSRMTRALLEVDDIPGSDDVTDACAVAVCHHHRARLSSVTRRQAGGGAVARRLAEAIARASATSP